MDGYLGRNSVFMIAAIGTVVAFFPLLFAGSMKDQTVWILVIGLVIIDAVIVIALSLKAANGDYRRMLSICEEFAGKNGFAKTPIFMDTKYVWGRWGGKTAGIWKGRYLGRDFGFGILFFPRSLNPDLMFENVAIYMETVLERGERFEPKQEYYMGSTGVLGLSVLCIVKGSQASVGEIEKAMASLKGGIRSQS